MSNAPFDSFEQRKSQHIQLALKPQNQATGHTGLDAIRLPHNALPEIDFQDIDLETSLLGKKQPNPFYIAGMTAGHPESLLLNKVLAEACQQKGWILGIGSQRRQLSDPMAFKEWTDIKKSFPQTKFLGNIGLTQVIPLVQKKEIFCLLPLVETLDAMGLVIHTNPLQEALQPEGTPYFKDGLKSLETVCRQLSIPVILKETGCGFSRTTLEALKGIGLAVVDISGLGGTHWGRIEGQRSAENSIFAKTAQTFATWGISTVESLCYARDLKPDYDVWASGGLRSGLDVAKVMALGAKAVGFAWPALKMAMEGVGSLTSWMSQIEYELKVALFCLGLKNVKNLSKVSL